MYTGYLLSDGVTDLSNVFMNINEAGLISANKFQQKMTCLGNIDLSGSFLYGRNDGYTFDTSLNSLIPVGYTLDISNAIATGTNGFSVGPLTINSGVTLTVASGQRHIVI